MSSHPLPPDTPGSGPQLPAYFNCIDALRVLAALGVVIFHYHHFYLTDYLARPDLPETDVFPFAPALGWVYDNGYLAVELFWVISGFVFMHVYDSKPTSLRRFALARFARLYPLHLAMLLTVAVMQWISLSQAGHWQIYGNNTLRYFLFQLVMGSHWTHLTSGLSFNGPIWSVSLEIGAYFVFFAALGTLRRFRLLAALLLVSVSWGLPVWPDMMLPLVQTGVFTCAGYFFSGVSLYFVFCFLAARPGLLLGLACGSAVLGWVLYVPGLKGWSLLAASAALILVAGLADIRLGDAGGWLKSMGNISYGLYLVHVPLQMSVLILADLFFDGTRSFAAHPATLPVYLVGSILASVWAFRWIERPARRYLRRVLSPKTA